jgi:endonuclease YncB( thermonuclease family)
MLHRLRIAPFFLARLRFGGVISLAVAIGLAAAAIFVARPSGRLIEGRAQVIDGDTLRVGGLDIRLRGLDAPERRQSCLVDRRSYACGETARDALRNRIGAVSIQCRISGRDRYQRALARCSAGGQDLGAWLVREGLAVAYGDYEREEASARARGAGLWAGSFERPSEWRQRHPPRGS